MRWQAFIVALFTALVTVWAMRRQYARSQCLRRRAPRGAASWANCLINVLLKSVVVLASVNAVQAAELQVIAGGGITGALNEIASLFERASGHKIVIRYGTTPELIEMATSGVQFDLGVVPQDVWNDPAARAQVAPGPTPDVARVGIGVAVRTGAAKPDISTPETLKQTLLKAPSIASIPASATGTQLASIYARLGITAEMNAKTKAQPGPKQIVEAVAGGEAELGVFLLNVLTDPRLDIVGRSRRTCSAKWSTPWASPPTARNRKRPRRSSPI
jgi:molybdate transport system substrate-binding protein